MKRYALMTAVSSILFVSGCATQKAWVFAPDPYRDVPALSSKRAVVLPFDDARENLNSNKLLLYLIPLVPYGWADYNIPEGEQMHVTSALWTNYKPTEDYAKALATELQNARIFKESYFDFRRGDAEIIVAGKIMGTKYTGRMISYGLSAYGPLLWLFGLPAGTVSNDLSIELHCVDAQSNRELFSKTYTAPPYSATVWLYSMPNDFNYPSMLKEVYEKFLDDLRGQRASLALRPQRAGRWGM